MSGQDSIIFSQPDTLAAVIHAPREMIFDVSEKAGSTISFGGGIEMVQRIHEVQPVWLFIYLFVLLGIFAWMRIYYGRILLQTVQAAADFQAASRIFNDNSLLQKQLDLILYILYFLSTALLLYYFETELDKKPNGLEGVMLYLFNIVALSGIFLGRIVTVNVAGFIFNRLRLFREYLYNIFIFNKVIGMIMLPLLLLLGYTTGILHQIIFWLTLSVIALLLIMRIFRGFVFSFKKDISIFYTFLYLCALEIVPLALLYRWLEGIL